jgi:hypothetical protein
MLCAHGAAQFGVDHALVAGGLVLAFVGLLLAFVGLLLALLPIREVRNGMHRRTLLAEAKQQYKRETQEQAAQHERDSSRKPIYPENAA